MLKDTSHMDPLQSFMSSQLDADKSTYAMRQRSCSQRSMASEDGDIGVRCSLYHRYSFLRRAR